MYTIQYHDTAGIAGQLDLNYRIDVEGSRYIFRAGKFIVNGVTYTMPEDTWFEDFGTAVQGTLWTPDPSQPLSLAVLPEDIVAAGMTSEIRNRWYADHGQRIMMVFCTVEHHFDVQSKKMTSGTRLMVSRCIPPGVAPADTIPAQPTANQVQAIQNSPAVQMAKAKMAAAASHPLTAARSKSWDQLDAQEKDAVMKAAAERMGLIQKA